MIGPRVHPRPVAMNRWTGPLALLVLVGLAFGGRDARGVAPSDCVTIDAFSTSKLGEFPPDWRVAKDEGKAVYSVQEEPGGRFLQAVARGLGIQAAKPYEWDLTIRPVLAWSWRPQEFPEGADERDPKTNDSVLAVYAVFPHSPWSVRSVKYVWSARVPPGTRLTSSHGLTQVQVLRSGTEDKGAWVEERVNVLEDYRRYFGDTGVPTPSGIAVLTDADDTRSRARGDYANFRVCRA